MEEKIGGNIKLKKVKDGPGILSVFCMIIVSLAFMAAGIALYLINQERMPYYKETTAIITDIDVDRYWDSDENEKTDYEVYVDYTVNGIQYTHREYDSWNIGMYEGQEITIFYDTRDPGKPLQSPKSLLIISCVLMGISLLPLIFVGKQIGDLVKESRRVKMLKETGIKKRLPIVLIENVNEFDSTAYHGKKISNRKYSVSISSGGRVRSYRHITATTQSRMLSSREKALLRDYNAGRTSLFIFGCENEGLVYESLCFHLDDEIFEGCTAEVYFDKNQYQDAVANKTWVKNYFIDMDSVEFGRHIANKKDKKATKDESAEEGYFHTSTHARGYTHTSTTVGKNKDIKEKQ